MRYRSPLLGCSFPPSPSATCLLFSYVSISARSRRPTFGSALEVTSDAGAAVLTKEYVATPDRPEGYSVEEETGSTASEIATPPLPPGDPKCPCIAIGNRSTDLKAVNTFMVNGKTAAYPAFTATCQAWDDGRLPGSCEKPDEVPGKGNGFCVLPFCFVDPCNCQPEYKPRRSPSGVVFDGHRSFLSYLTCGVEARGLPDLVDGCSSRSTAEKCAEESDCKWLDEVEPPLCIDRPPENCGPLGESRSSPTTQPTGLTTKPASVQTPTSAPSQSPTSTLSQNHSSTPSSRGCHVRPQKGCPKSDENNSVWKTLSEGNDQDNCTKGWLNFQERCGSREVLGLFVEPPLQVYLYDTSTSTEENIVSEPGCYWRTASACANAAVALETNVEVEVTGLESDPDWAIKYMHDKDAVKALTPSEDEEEDEKKLEDENVKIANPWKRTKSTAGIGSNAAKCQKLAFELMRGTLSCSVQTLFVPERADGLSPVEYKALVTIGAFQNSGKSLPAHAVGDGLPAPAALDAPVDASAYRAVEISTEARAARILVKSAQDKLKRQAGYKAVDDYVTNGTVIGLGSGSTAAFAVERVGDKLASGELSDIKVIPTSVQTAEQAKALGIPLTSLDNRSDIDIAIEGADDVDPDLNLVKGGGGTLFREKIVVTAAKKFIVIVDETKLSKGIGPGFPIPVEIVPFSYAHTMKVIAALPALKDSRPVLRLGNLTDNKPDGDTPAVTENGNYIVDLFFNAPMSDLLASAQELKNTVGVVEHGLFISMTTACIIAGENNITVKTSRGNLVDA